jgi:hypothetical protein
MKSFFSALLIASLLTLSACGGGSGGSVSNPWERAGQTPVAAENPDSLEIRNQWLNKTTPPVTQDQ